MKTSEEAKNALRAFGRDLAKPASREVASSSGRTENDTNYEVLRLKCVKNRIFSD